MTNEVPYRWAPRTDRLFNKDRDAEILTHITEAHNHVRALQELLYGVGRQYRGFWYLGMVNRAQSLLIRVLNKELKRKRS